jgi:hypothetical protein
VHSQNESIFAFTVDLGCPIHSAFLERNGWDTEEIPVFTISENARARMLPMGWMRQEAATVRESF